MHIYSNKLFLLRHRIQWGILIMVFMLAGCATETAQVTPDEIAVGVYRIKASRSNIYLLAGETLILIDTGMKGDAAAVLAAIHGLGRQPTEVSHILITHGHIDHTGSLAVLKRETGATVIASADDRDFIEGRRKTAAMGREGVGGKIFKVVLYLMETVFFRYEPAAVDSALSGDTALSLPGITIQAIATPGHSPGSFSFYLPDKKIIFTGDALTGVPKPTLPPRMGCADYGQAISSAKKISDIAFDICCFGHGDPVYNNADTVIRKLLNP